MTDLEFYHSMVHGERHTIGDFIRGVFAVKAEEDAGRFYRGCVAGIQAQIDSGEWESRYTAEQGAKANIGWAFGEGMEPSQIALWRSCGASHPVFGTSMPSMEDALQAGKDAAR